MLFSKEDIHNFLLDDLGLLVIWDDLVQIFNKRDDLQWSCNSPFFFFCLFRATPVAYGSSRVRGQITAVPYGLCHSNTGAEPHL